MLKISKQQAIDRWDMLPQNLKESIFDEKNIDTVWNFCEKNHLNEEKIRGVATAAGDVIMGFLHPDPDEIAKEIQERINLPKPLALEIANELHKKIFLPLKTDLEKIYSPPRETEPTPVISAQTQIEPLPEYKKPPVREIPAPANLPFDSIREKPAEPSIVGEVVPPVASGVEPTSGELAEPFILHEEKPLFTPEAPKERPSVSFEIKPDIKKPPPERPAKAKVSLPEGEGEAKVVHYSDLRTPLEN